MAAQNTYLTFAIAFFLGRFVMRMVWMGLNTIPAVAGLGATPSSYLIISALSGAAQALVVAAIYARLRGREFGAPFALKLALVHVVSVLLVIGAVLYAGLDPRFMILGLILPLLGGLALVKWDKANDTATPR